MLYKLAALDCPIPWPEKPNYPIDSIPGPSTTPLASQPTKTQRSAGRAVIPDAQSVKTRYLNALYHSASPSLPSQPASDAATQIKPLDRISDFGNLISASQLPTELLESLLLSLSHLDKKWRSIVPALLQSQDTVSLESTEEHLALLKAYAAWEEDSNQHESDKAEKWKKAQMKRWVGMQELQEYAFASCAVNQADTEQTRITDLDSTGATCIVCSIRSTSHPCLAFRSSSTECTVIRLARHIH